MVIGGFGFRGLDGCDIAVVYMEGFADGVYSNFEEVIEVVFKGVWELEVEGDR